MIKSSLADASVIGTVFVASIGGHSGKNANSGIARDDGKRKAKQQRATLMRSPGEQQRRGSSRRTSRRRRLLCREKEHQALKNL
jgi:hypothetical protein